MTDAKQEMIYKDFVKHCFFMVLTWYPAQTNTANPQETFTGRVGDSLPGWKTYLCIQTADRAPFTSRWRKEQWYQIINNEQIILIKHSDTNTIFRSTFWSGLWNLTTLLAMLLSTGFCLFTPRESLQDGVWEN